MTDPAAAEIIDRLVVRLVYPDEAPTDPEVYMEAIEYLMRTRRDHPDHQFSTRLWREMAARGLIT